MTDQLKEDAEVLRRGMLLGLVPVARIVAWTDRRIAGTAAEQLPTQLLDVAISGGRTNSVVAALLADVPGHADVVRASRRVLGLLAEWYATHPEDGGWIARTIYHLAAAGDLPEDAFGTEAYSLDDLFANPAVSTPEQAHADLLKFLQRYADVPAV